MILHSKIFNAESTRTPLLIFHGLFGSLDNWQTLAIEFSKERPVHTIDLRNHGRSFHSSEMNYEVMAKDIENYVVYYNLTKIMLLGHSMGGKVVMEYLKNNENRVEKAIVADMGIKAYPPHHQAIIKSMESVDFQKIHKRSDVDLALQKYIQELSVRQFILKNVYKMENGEYNFRFNLPIISKNYLILMRELNFLKKIEIPTSFVKGSLSSYILPEDEIEIKKTFEKSTFIIIDNAGHWLHADNPNMFLTKITNFINI